MSLPLPKGEGRTDLQFLICSFTCTQTLTPRARGAPRGALRSKQVGFLLLERQGILFTLHKFDISKPKSVVWQPINTHPAGFSLLPWCLCEAHHRPVSQCWRQPVVTVHYPSVCSSCSLVFH